MFIGVGKSINTPFTTFIMLPEIRVRVFNILIPKINVTYLLVTYWFMKIHLVSIE